MSFREWMRTVNREVESIWGMDVYDLPDCSFRDEYDAGTEPREMAVMVLENAGFDFY